MSPHDFKEKNVVYAKDQPEYLPLPAHVCDGSQGEIITCWKMTFFEKIRVLFTGKIWVSLIMFRNAHGGVNPLTPSRVYVENPFKGKSND